MAPPASRPLAVMMAAVLIAEVAVGVRELPRVERARALASRRSALLQASSAVAALSLLPAAPPAAHAAAVASQAELDRLVVGYNGIRKLLENWDLETIKCYADESSASCKSSEARRQAASSNMAKCSCDFDPARVQEVMGFKSTKHPLYLADQVMIRAQPLLAPDADFEAYDAAIEEWAQRAENANVMSYTSSWGEANPGGGRDAVKKYLDRSKAEVEKSAALLRKVLSFLPVKVDGAA